MIKVKCTSCGYSNQVSDQSAGRSGKCQRCRGTYRVPAGAKPVVRKNKPPISYQVKTPASPVQFLLDKLNITPVGWEILKPILILIFLLVGYWVLNSILGSITSFSTAMILYAGAVILQLILFGISRGNTPNWFWSSALSLSLLLMSYIAWTDQYAVADYTLPGVSRAFVYSRWHEEPDHLLEVHTRSEGKYDYFYGPLSPQGERHGEWKRWNRNDLFINKKTFGWDVKTHPLWFWEGEQVNQLEWDERNNQ